MTTLEKVWEQQLRYNMQVQGLQERSSAEWMETYILGMMSEMGELLQEMNWKKHRLRVREDFGPNVSEELADITKFAFSMWQMMGLGPEQMLEACYQKGKELEQKFAQEHRSELRHSLVLMLDLDGVVADFRTGFENWISQHEKYKDQLPSLMQQQAQTLHMDINNGWSFNTYEQAKEEFEEEGGYARLPVMRENVEQVRRMKDFGFHIVIWTARPYPKLKRVWKDTYHWLDREDVPFDEINFGGDRRVIEAIKYREGDNWVIAVEDNPSLASRYEKARIPTLLVPHSYNREERESLIKKFASGRDLWGKAIYFLRFLYQFKHLETFPEIPEKEQV